MVIEAKVHASLLAWQRQQQQSPWLHHLTMARLVARALRLGRSALIQTSTSSDRHGLSYVTPALLGDFPLVIVAPETVLDRLEHGQFPALQRWLQTERPVVRADHWPGPQFTGICLTTPQQWLSDRLGHQQKFPRGITTLIEGSDDLETWVRQALTITLTAHHWQLLSDRLPAQRPLIQRIYHQLKTLALNRAPNPYGCYLLNADQEALLIRFTQQLAPLDFLPPIWRKFFQQWQAPHTMAWAEIDHRQGRFQLNFAPLSLAPTMRPLWHQQPLVIVGSFLDPDREAGQYQTLLGLENLTCLQFASDRHQEDIQLYLPDRLPFPNTPEFSQRLLEHLGILLGFAAPLPGLTVVLVADVPLKAQVGAALAARFGSQVRVENTEVTPDGILVCGWEFWLRHYDRLPCPTLLAIATLPLPSPEHPLVATKVDFYRRHHQDWFRTYLLPTALTQLQRSILPIRPHQGVVALLDNRVNHRTYGKYILKALEPCARYNYLDPGWFGLT